MTGGITEDEVRDHRLRLGVRPIFKRIDSCAAEFDAATPYLYSTYEAPLFDEPVDEAEVSDRRKVMILGGGPNRIGQGIEFDYCCCHAAFALGRDRNGQTGAGFEVIMVNCNPETVSTDPDTSDRLYFEPLTAEDVLEIVRREQDRGELLGLIVQLGGQTPLKLAEGLQMAGVPILGTSPDSIDLAEDRERFATLVQQLNLKQPANGIARSREEALRVAERIGYPVLLRPSYVLGGRGMEVVEGPQQLEYYIATAVAGIRPEPGPDRSISSRRDRGGRRRDLRWDRSRGMRRAAAHRRSGRALGRQRLFDPAVQPRNRDRGRNRAADPRACAGAEGPGSDERPVRGQGQ